MAGKYLIPNGVKVSFFYDGQIEHLRQGTPYRHALDEALADKNRTIVLVCGSAKARKQLLERIPKERNPITIRWAHAPDPLPPEPMFGYEVRGKPYIYTFPPPPRLIEMSEARLIWDVYNIRSM